MFGIIGLLGAFLVVACTCLDWATYDLVPLGYSYGVGGWDFFSGHVELSGYDLPILEVSSYYYAPGVAAMTGAVGILAAIVGVAGGGKTAYRTLTALSMVLAVASAALILLFSGDVGVPPEVAPVISVSTAYGIWLGVAAAVVMIVGGVGNLFVKKVY